MWNALLSVLLLATVSSTTSNLLPVMTASDLQILLDVDGQPNHNIIRNTRQLYNIFYTVPIGMINSQKLNKDDDASDYTKTLQPSVPDVFPEENYVDGGYRKEQWHNYPRQLDRLQKHVRNRHDTEKFTPDDLLLQNTLDYVTLTKILKIYDASHKLRPHVFHESHKTKTDEAENRIELENVDSSKTYQMEKGYGNLNDKEAITQDLFPVINVKKGGGSFNPDVLVSDETPKKTKRLFSLWSRLQSMSYKGHELPHRRHMALYAMPYPPGMTHTAETRAMMRPPGSPLRWG